MVKIIKLKKILNEYHKKLETKDLIFLSLFSLFLLCLILAYNYQRTNPPLVIYPLNKDIVNPSNVYITYQTFPEDYFLYDTEISKYPHFVYIDHMCYNTSSALCYFEYKFDENSKYYIRTRSKIDGAANRWSKPRVFYTGDNYPIPLLGDFV